MAGEPVRCRRRASFRLLLTVILLAGLVSCGPRQGGSETSPDPPESETPDLAPDFALEDVHGNTVRLSDSDGTVRLVDFWATWCAPCREEVPMFKDLHEKYGGKGLTIVAISLDERGAEAVRPFAERYGLTYTSLIGSDDVAQGFGQVLGLPTKFLLDRDRRIVEQLGPGPVPQPVLEGRIRDLLGLEPAS